MTEELEQAPEGTLRPYVVFERIRNRGIREKIGANGQVIQKGEHPETWKCFLADERGELHTWATVGGMQGYVAKGYTPIQLVGFDEYLARKDPNQDLVQELRALQFLFGTTVAETKKLRAIAAENEELKAQLEALQSSVGNTSDAANANSKLLEESAKVRDELEAANKKLLAEMEAQRKELEALRKQSEKDKAALKAAEGKTVVESTKGGQSVG